MERREATLTIVDSKWLQLLSPYDRRRAEARVKRFERVGIDGELAMDVALLRSRASSFDVIALAERTGLEPRKAAELFYAVGSKFRIDRVRAALLKTEPESHWDALALRHIQEELFAAQGDFAARVAEHGVEGEPKEAISRWIKVELGGLSNYEETVRSLLQSGKWTVAKFSIVTALLANLRQPARAVAAE